MNSILASRGQVGENCCWTQHELEDVFPSMTLHLELIPLISVIACICVLIFPRLLKYIVGIYLIAIGLLDMVM